MLARERPCGGDRVVGHGHGLQHRAGLKGHCVRQNVAQFFWYADELRKRAIYVQYAQITAVGTDIGKARLTEATLSARGIG